MIFAKMLGLQIVFLQERFSHGDDTRLIAPLGRKTRDLRLNEAEYSDATHQANHQSATRRRESRR